MFRLIFLTFHGEPKMPKVFEGIHESPSLMTAPLVILAALSTYIFYTLPINLIPWKDYGWFTKLIKAKDSVVAGTPSAKEIYDGVHYMHDLALVLSLTVASIGIGLSFLMYYRSTISSKSWAKRFGPFYRLSLNKYYFDEIYNRVFYQPFLKLCNIVAIIDWDLYDKYFINGFGHVTKLLSKVTGQVDYDGLDQTLVDGVGRSAGGLGKGLKNIQTGRLQNYMLFALIGVIIILIVQYSVIL
jgi:NADH-quinone oxidoreductase subunit L